MTEIRCYEVEIEESEKAGSRWESNQGHLACTIGLFTFLYFRLVKSKFQHEARALSNYNYVCFTAAEIIKKADRPNIKIEFVSAHYVYGLLLQEENFSFPIHITLFKKKNFSSPIIRCISHISKKKNFSSPIIGYISRTENGWKSL